MFVKQENGKKRLGNGDERMEKGKGVFIGRGN